MKNNNKLITVLYIISRLSFCACLLFLLLQLVFEFTPNGQLGNFNAYTHHSKGYSVKTRIQLNIPDTLIVYKNSFDKSSGTISKTGIKKFDDYFNKIKKNKQAIKNYQMNSFEIYNSKYIDIKKEFVNVKIQDVSSELEITVNPKDYFFKSILIIKNYLFLTLALFVTYQCIRMFKQLRMNFAFDKLLKQRIRNIGYSLILFQIVNMIISIIITQYLSKIRYYHYSSIDNLKFEFMNLFTTIEYNFEILFLGLCLVVLSKLLNYGYDIQNENALTI